MKRFLVYIILCIFIVSCAKEAEFDVLKNDDNLDTSWWKIYKNDEFNNSLNAYFQSDYEIKNKTLMLDYISVENSLLRNYSFDGSLRADISKPLSEGEKNTKFSGNLGFKYKLDIFGKNYDKKRAKMLELLSANDEIGDLKQQNAHKIITMILNKQHLSLNSSLLSKKLENLQLIYDLSKYENSIGKLGYVELLEDESKLDNAKTSIIYNNLDIKKIEDSLRDLGFVYDGELELLDSDFEKYLKTVRFNKDLVLKKYKILSKNKKVQIKNINYLVSQKDMYVDLSLNAFLSSSSDKAKSMFDFGVFGGGVGVDFGFLDYANVKDRIKLSKLDYDMAKNDYENFVKVTFNYTQNTLSDYAFYLELFDINDKILQRSKSIYEEKLFKYNLKMISKKELLSYENAFIDAQISFNKAKNDLNKARCDILYAFGVNM